MNKCTECNKILKDGKATRCWECYSIHRINNRKKYLCIDCGKTVHCHTFLYGTKRCYKCSLKFRIKNGTHPTYIDGRWKIQRICIDCGINLASHNIEVKRCRKCFGLFERGKNNPMYGKSKIIHKHHIYLKENGGKIIEVSNDLHRKIHSYSYNYLVELGIVDKYLIWFQKKFNIKF